jgi:hypothetical protein
LYAFGLAHREENETFVKRASAAAATAKIEILIQLALFFYALLPALLVARITNTPQNFEDDHLIYGLARWSSCVVRI